jgi:hypothetical protein
MKYVGFPWPLIEAALSIFDLSFFVKGNFLEGINKSKAGWHQCQIIRFLICIS